MSRTKTAKRFKPIPLRLVRAQSSVLGHRTVQAQTWLGFWLVCGLWVTGKGTLVSSLQSMNVVLGAGHVALRLQPAKRFRRREEATLGGWLSCFPGLGVCGAGSCAVPPAARSDAPPPAGKLAVHLLVTCSETGVFSPELGLRVPSEVGPWHSRLTRPLLEGAERPPNSCEDVGPSPGAAQRREEGRPATLPCGDGPPHLSCPS